MNLFNIDPKKVAPWVKPLLILVAISGFLFFVNRIIDLVLLKAGIRFFADLYTVDIGTLTNTLGGLGEVVTAVLGLEITVIAIIVQLAANKYSSDIMDLFIANPVNYSVIGFYVIASINTILVVNTIKESMVPYFSITFALFCIVISLLMVIPHFNYVFNFLRPVNFLDYIKLRVLKQLRQIKERKINYSSELKDSITTDLNFIGDIALNTAAQGDRSVPILCIGMLREITVRYFEYKPHLPKEWFRLSGMEYFDPDFSSYSRFVMKQIEDRKIFLERKVFRLFEMLFDNSRLNLRDVASSVLLNSELIASGAIKSKDDGALHNVFQYFNSYLRIAIRGKDPRSAFNTLEHYRILGEELLDANPDEVLQICFYIKYYGQEANKNQVLFILETAAHDLCQINEIAYEKKVYNLKELLQLFLTVDEPIDEVKESERAARENSLIGVRIAQAKLAGFYLLKGDVELARIIYDDMKLEPLARIEKIKEIIFNTKLEEFWEITPRGVNFNYVSTDRREALVEFFQWFQ